MAGRLKDVLCVFPLTEQQSSEWRNLFFWLLHTWLERGENSLQCFSTQFHDGFREEASQAFQVAEQQEGSIVEESR